MGTDDFTFDVRLAADECCKYCASERGKIIQAGPHRKLICASCGKYLKFIGAAEFARLTSQAVDESPSADEDRLARIEFKLDLILDHLNIANQ